jgi:hypothetical protein
LRKRWGRTPVQIESVLSPVSFPFLSIFFVNAGAATPNLPSVRIGANADTVSTEIFGLHDSAAIPGSENRAAISDVRVGVVEKA